MLHDIYFALWFLLPAGAANVAPIVSGLIPFVKRWQTPIDGGHTWCGQELLGSHKTWRGLIAGVLAATFIFWLQQLAFKHFGWAHSLAGDVVYDSLPTLIVGPLFGLGALGGDAVASFFKRRRGVRSGHTWIPFDQLDYIVGALVLMLPFIVLAPAQYMWILVLWFVVHIFSSYAGWRIGVKERPI